MLNLKGAIECPEKTCNLEFHFSETCLIFSKSLEKPFCDIPCNMTKDLCKVEQFHDVQCPVWYCKSKTTTTSTTERPTTESPTTVAPTPPPRSFCFTDPSCISSVSVNGIFVLIAAMFVFYGLKKRRDQRRRQRLITESSPILRGVPNDAFFSPAIERSEPSYFSHLTQQFARNREREPTAHFTRNSSTVHFENIPLLAGRANQFGVYPTEHETQL